MAANGGVMSNKQDATGKGFDYDIARTFTDRLGLHRHVTWFESEDEEESDPVVGVLWYETALNRPAGDRGALPDPGGLKVGIEPGTLAGMLTLRQGKLAMVANAVTRNPGPGEQ